VPSFDGRHSRGAQRLEPLRRRIRLLNRDWHRGGRPERFGICAGCEQDVKAEDRAVHLHGELYHSGCASLVRRPEQAERPLRVRE
jgi:hypothetical protein